MQPGITCQHGHQNGHSKFDCHQSKARILCYACHEQGHRSYECTRRNSIPPSNKKQDKKSYRNKKSKDDQRLEIREEEVTTNSSKDNNEQQQDPMSEDEQIFLDNVVTIQEELDSMTEEKVQQAINDVQLAKEIEPILKKK